MVKWPFGPLAFGPLAFWPFGPLALFCASKEECHIPRLNLEHCQFQWY